MGECGGVVGWSPGLSLDGGFVCRLGLRVVCGVWVVLVVLGVVGSHGCCVVLGLWLLKCLAFCEVVGGFASRVALAEYI